MLCCFQPATHAQALPPCIAGCTLGARLTTMPLTLESFPAQDVSAGDRRGGWGWEMVPEHKVVHGLASHASYTRMSIWAWETRHDPPTSQACTHSTTPYTTAREELTRREGSQHPSTSHHKLPPPSAQAQVSKAAPLSPSRDPPTAPPPNRAPARK